MAKRTEIQWIHEGFEAILCCNETMELVREHAIRICERANTNNHRGGSGFDMATRQGRAYGSQRAMGFVYSTDQKSKLAESEDKALSKAVTGE